MQLINSTVISGGLYLGGRLISEGSQLGAYIRGAYIRGLISGVYIPVGLISRAYNWGLISGAIYPRGLYLGGLYPVGL